MDELLEQMFIFEINTQCDIALVTYDDLKIYIRDIPNMRDKKIWDARVWGALQSILVATGNISKIFRPPPPYPYDKNLDQEQKQRGLFLCNKFSVEESSNLLSRSVRNDLEHLDSRFHIWRKESSNISHRNVSIEGGISIEPNKSGKSYMANFDPETFILTFWENRFPINEIIRDITQLSIKTSYDHCKLSVYKMNRSLALFLFLYHTI